MIHTLCSAAMAACLLLSVVSCGSKEELKPVEEKVLAVEISMEEVTIQTGGEIALTANVYPETIDTTVIWMSADESIASVSDGLVKGVKAGSTVISARCGNVIGQCRVDVVESTVQDVILDQTNLEMDIDEEVQLAYEVVPANAGEYTATWSSRDDRIAQVSAEGVVRARSVGSTVITLSVNGVEALCYVKVRPVDVTSITLSQDEVTLEEGGNVLLNAIVAPTNATYQDVSWESSDLSVATVIRGRVTALRAGNAVITASAGGMEATCDVTVTASTSVRYAVGDVFTDENGNRGIVYQITDNGAHGKVLGLKKSQYGYYSTEEVFIGATSTDNGKENTGKVRQTANYATAYPAFKWIEDNYGQDWYVPSQEELLIIGGLKNDLNTYLMNEGGDWIGTWLVSSTEASAGECVYITALYGSISHSNTSKSDEWEIWAVYEF